MTTAARTGRRLLFAIGSRLLFATLATLATVLFSYVLLHQNSNADPPRAPYPPLTTVVPGP
ncbi:hypothetical protein [Nocardia altamirensis]|uniref:hypothetical protein n=1 Tax=Nocardia altamirensis TaxID=472158 RepID=UPI00084081C1|nr:hypothetical protein [Nocardia altamirensis]